MIRTVAATKQYLIRRGVASARVHYNQIFERWLRLTDVSVALCLCGELGPSAVSLVPCGVSRLSSRVIFCFRTSVDRSRVLLLNIGYHGRKEPHMLDWAKCGAVESVPGKVSGAWVFRATRIPVAAVFENLEDGLTIDQVVDLYDGLKREQVQAVLEFAAQSLESQPASH